jgi:hypothetical protein
MLGRLTPTLFLGYFNSRPGSSLATWACSCLITLSKSPGFMRARIGRHRHCDHVPPLLLRMLLLSNHLVILSVSPPARRILKIRLLRVPAAKTGGAVLGSTRRKVLRKVWMPIGPILVDFPKPLHCNLSRIECNASQRACTTPHDLIVST